MLDLEYLTSMIQGYGACLLWQATTEIGAPLDDDFGTNDFAPEAVAQMAQDVSAFYADNIKDLMGMEAEQAGHDFCLTRNCHGAGFWDRGLGARGDRLSAASRPYGAMEVYASSGQLHVS
jgi:hypothetical protein